MDRRKACSLSAAFILGIAAAEYQKTLLWCILVLYGLAWAYFIGKTYKVSLGTVCWLAAFFAASCGGIFDSCSQKMFCNAYVSGLSENKKCLVQGEIYQKEKEDEKVLFYLKNCRVQFDQKNYPCNQILLYLNAENYSIGEILCVKGKIKTFNSAANEGNYDEKAYFQTLKIDFKVAGERVVSVCGKKNAFLEYLAFFKEKMKESYETAMPKADAGVLTAMILGDKSLMEKERKGLYQSAGISHFYSISGLHISMIGMALYHLIKKGSGSYFISGAVSAALMFGYGALTGFGISVSRAVGMFFLLLYAKFRGRSYDRPTALALVAAVLAGKNPNLLHHAGFLLSFGAVLGVIFAEWMFSAYSGAKKEEGIRFLERIKEGIRVSFFIQLVTVPVLCRFFYEICIYSIPVNMIILPCMGALLLLGVFGGISGCLFPFIGKWILYPCYLILLLFDYVCRFFLKLPAAVWITGRLADGILVFWYVLLFVFFFLKKYRKKFPDFLFLLPFCFLFFVPGSRTEEIDILDVGQGDGIYICAGEGTSIFIDGGSSSIKNAGTYRILPFLKYKGIKSMDYWFVSHCDADHINGLCEIIESGYAVKNLVVSAYMPKDEAWKKLEETAKMRRIQILAMSKGDKIRGRPGSFLIRCLSLKHPKNQEGRNENSLVLLFESRAFCAFFAGDIGQEQERALAQAWDLPQVDLYKASHHGSDNSNCSELLQELKPKMTVISCGLKNRYGHPGEKALARIAKNGCKIYETRFLGQIKILSGLEAKGYSVLKSPYEDN